MPVKVNWKEFLRDHHIGLSGKVRKGVYLECNCPFCHNDTNYHGAINIQTNAYNCFKCGRHSYFELVSAVVGCLAEPREVFKALKEYRNSTDFDFVVPREEQEEVIQIKKNLKMPGTSPLSKPYRNYLIKRGLNPDYMEKHYDLKAGGIGGEWKFRLMIPVYENGELVAWQGRAISPNEKIRYKASSLKESVNVKELLYNINNCHYDKVIVVEGVFDAWRFGTDCVAVFGISLKDKQIHRLAERFKEVYILFDWGEEQAKASAEMLQKKLRSLGVSACVLDVSDTKAEDPATLSAEEIVEIKKYVFGGVPNYDYSLPQLLKEN